MGQQHSSSILVADEHKAHKDLSSSRTDSSGSLAASSSDDIFHSSYAIEDLLGHGSSASVYRVRHKETGRRFAAKEVGLDNKMNTTDSLRTELEILQSLHHEHVVGLQESFKEEEKLWMVLEEVKGGDLVQACASLPIYSEREVAKLFRQLLLGVKYLHEQGVVHRDLKMENVLVGEGQGQIEGVVKVTDFGLAAKLPKKPSKRSKQLKEMWGTVEYFAPEVYARAYGAQADVWSLGCVLFEMLTGQLAFPHKEMALPVLDRLLLYGAHKPRRPFELRKEWGALSEGARDLLRKMLRRSKTRRLSVEECLQHSWIKQMEENPAGEIEGVRRKMRERLERRRQRHEKQREKTLPHLLVKQPSREMVDV